MPADKPKIKKPPTCDRCKAKRVLCHPVPGGSCPRCLENGAECTTTPVSRRPRGTVPEEEKRPRRQSRQPQASTSASVEVSRSSTPNGASPVYYTISSGSNGLQHYYEELPPDVVQHLVTDGYDILPISTHPGLPIAALRSSLTAVAFNPGHLPLPQQALCACICACSSLQSVHPTIIGAEGYVPQTWEEVEGHEELWESYGRRRQPVFARLRRRAFDLVKEANVVAGRSDPVSAAACFFADHLDSCRPHDSTTAHARPYASAYLAHLRTMAENWVGAKEQDFASMIGWSSFLSTEAVRAAQSGRPIVFTTGDQHLLYASESWTLDQLASKLRDQSTAHDSQLLFRCLRPYSSHVITFARKLDESVCGTVARRSPITSTVIATLVAHLQQLQTVYQLFLSRLELLIAGTQAPIGSYLFGPVKMSDGSAFLCAILHAVRLFVAAGYTRPALSLHFALAQADARPRPVSGLDDEAERGRLSSLADNVQEMARDAAKDWGRWYQNSGIGAGSHYGGRAEAWAEVLLDEAREKGLRNDTRDALHSIRRFLSALRFSHVDLSLDRAIIAISTVLDPAPPPPPPTSAFASFPSLALSAPPHSFDLSPNTPSYPNDPSLQLDFAMDMNLDAWLAMTAGSEMGGLDAGSEMGRTGASHDG